MLCARVWHAGVPRPQVPNHNVALAAERLDGRTRLHTARPGLFRNGRQRVVHAAARVGLDVFGRRRHDLVGRCGVGVRPEPELGRAVLNGKVAQRDVGDEKVREQGVRVAAVLVYGLADSARVCQRYIGCQPVPDGLVPKVTIDL